MKRVVTPITQIYIANQTLNDFLFVLTLVFEGDLLRGNRWGIPEPPVSNDAADDDTAKPGDIYQIQIV